MTWANARAAIKTLLDGQTISSPYAETLKALEYPPPGELGADVLPLAFIVPSGRSVSWRPMMRYTDFDAIPIRVYLGPPNAENIEVLATRYEAWVEKIIALFDTAQTINGTADVVRSLDISGLSQFGTDERPGAWGFDVNVSTHLHEEKSLAT